MPEDATPKENYIPCCIANADDDTTHSEGCKNLAIVSIDQVWKRELQFQDEYFPNWRTWSRSFLSNAYVGEGGEFTDEVIPIELAILFLRSHVAQGKVANIAKKIDGGGTNRKGNISIERCIEENADKFIYLVLEVESMGCSMERFAAVVNAKIEKNMARMKPGQFV